MKSPDDAHFQQWEDNPEPNVGSLDPQVILDTNLEGTVWLYDSQNEGDAWITYEGETMDIEQ